MAFRTGIDLSQQILPTEPEYLYLPEAGVSLSLARAAVVEWPNLELRKEAITLIKTLEDELAGSQRQLLLRSLDDYSMFSRQAVEDLFGLLREASA
ncbi:MAG: hypothetical protein WEC75_14350 [Dehalococcoidia bacterium]